MSKHLSETDADVAAAYDQMSANLVSAMPTSTTTSSTSQDPFTLPEGGAP